MDLAQLVVQVKQKQAAKSLDNIQNKLQDVGKTAENIGKTLLAGWSFTKILDSFKSFSNMLNDVNTQARNFKSIFGDSLDYANSQVQNLIKNFDQTQRSAQKLMSQIGMKVVEIGFSPLDATKITSQFAVISEQISAATNKPIEEVAKKLTNALTGETGGLRELGMIVQTNSASFKQQVKLLMQSKDLTAEQAKKQAILNTVLKQSQKYTGAFKETANTISHQLDNIKNTFKSGIGAQIGSILNKLLVPVLKIVDRVLSLPIVKDIGAVSGAITILIGMFSSIWIILKKIFGFGWGKLAGYINKVISSVREYDEVIKETSTNIEENIRKIKQSNKQKRQELLLNKLIARQIGTAAPGYQQHNAKVRLDSLKKNSISNILNQVDPPGFGQGVIKATFLIEQLQYILLTSSSRLLNNIGNSLGPAFDNISQFIILNSAELGKDFAKHIVKAFEIGDSLNKLMNMIGTHFIAGYKWMNKILIAGGDAISKSMNKITTVFITAVDSMEKKVSKYIASKIPQSAGKFMYKLNLWIMKLLGWVVTGLVALAGALAALAKVIVLPIVAIVAVAALAYQVQQWISKIIIQRKWMWWWQTDTSLNKWRTRQKHDELVCWSK